MPSRPVLRPTILDLDPVLEERLGRLSTTRNRAPGGLIHEAIAQYVSREEAGARLRADALEAWTDIKATGEHIPDEAVDAWLARLEAGEEADAPTCRG